MIEKTSYENISYKIGSISLNEIQTITARTLFCLKERLSEISENDKSSYSGNTNYYTYQYTHLRQPTFK